MRTDKTIRCPCCTHLVYLYCNVHGYSVWCSSDHVSTCNENWMRTLTNMDNTANVLNSGGINLSINLNELQERIDNYYPIWEQVAALQEF